MKVSREYAIVAAIAIGQAGVKIGAGILMIKALATVLGPGDLAYFGQVHSGYLIVSGLASAFLGAGLVAALARESDRPARRASTLQVADRASLALFGGIALAVVGLWLSFGGRWRASIPHADLLMAAGLAGVALQAVYTRSLSVLTTLDQVPRYGALTTGYALATAALVAGSTMLAGLGGSFVGLVLASTAGALAGGLLVRGRMVATADGVPQAGTWKVILALGAFGLVGVLAPQACLLAVRALLIDGVSPEAAGIWHGMSRLSDAVLAPVVTIVSIYFLPKYARVGLAGSGEILRRGLLAVAVPFACVAVLLWTQRDVVIGLAFTPEFVSMRDLFAWQMAGDVVRVIGWIVAYSLLGAGLTAWLAALELAHAAAYIAGVAMLLPVARELSGSMAYLAANTLYLAAVLAVYLGARRRPPRTEPVPA